ncbi:PEP-CTERM domain protein [Leptospirillum ferriphilum]|jgi:hypothetical protein|uniref:PEP-CTERM protein-sorting domain-containing protein n=1 Tax=Leptospirillum ferriphilum TaxID=178606 RepID=A0A094X3K2_9BACT|nr:PEP-CTERM domain protein [Leptospirillum ferriphilum]EAY57286.1 MAG: hypothetical protein UBAL2_79310125 [Leptospirillum rubarum]KGA93154.1 hypothetical protein LptCag_1849 [Leptospirillum ferriphilum]
MRVLGLAAKMGVAGCFFASILFAETAKATALDFTGWAFDAATINSIAPDGGTGTPFNTNANTGNSPVVEFNPNSSLTDPIDASYSTPQGAITSDINTLGNLSNTGAITLTHNISITNSFPDSLDYGVGGQSDITFSGYFLGNGNTFTIPISFSAIFSNTAIVKNSTNSLSVTISGGPGLTETYYAPLNDLSTGNGLLTDFTFQTVAGDKYNLFVSSQLSGDILNNASADLILLLGAPISSQSPVSATPEPPTFWLMASGILGMFGLVGYRKMKATA